MRDGIKESIRAFVAEKREEAGIRHETGDDDSLIDSGMLDSLTILELISFLDRNFSVIPAEDELDPNNFDTINRIYNFILKKASR